MGQAPDCFLTRVFSDLDKTGVSESDAAYVALKLVAAASDTVSSVELQETNFFTCAKITCRAASALGSFSSS